MPSESDDDYAEFGTPLEPLDEDDCPRKKPITLEEQVARDKDGRRRFHGAFTGGFSAGFLNTVGSLEGFHPSSFKSSKSEKGASIVQKPEDFMDDEDVGEFGIAPSVLRAKEDYQSNLSYKRKYPGYSSNNAFSKSSVLKSLLQPVRETVGIKLLRKMGWKPGQGVGPRITKHEKRRISKMRKKVYGCSLPNKKSDTDESESDTDDEELKNVTFAPSDCPFQLITPKENFFGLGYKGLDKRSILSAPQSKSEFNVRSKKTITGQAFGVGALEEEDEDIYSREDMSQYDFMLGDNGKEESASGCVTSEDLYDAFVLTMKRRVQNIFNPPVLPLNFKSVRKNSRFEPLPPDPQKSRRLSPSPERMTISEEAEKIQKEARKITESISVKTSGVFKPFISDPDKQARYEKYLQLLDIGKPGDLNNHQPITMTEWDKEKERIEFEQAAKLFKPLSGIMEDRFTVGSQPDDINNPLAPVEKLNSGTEDEIKAARMNMYGSLTRRIENWKPCSLLCKRFNIPELNINEIPIVKNKPKYSIFDDLSISIQEAKSQTRENTEVLSKPSETDENEKTKESKADENEKTKESKADENEKTKESEADENEKTKESQNLGLNEVIENKIDLFNMIFLDTDSEDEVQTESKSSRSEKQGQNDGESKEILHDSVSDNERNTSPPRGLFANLDYGFLLSKKKTTETKEPNRKKPDNRVPSPSSSQVKGKDTHEVEDRDINLELLYGPRLPEKFPTEKVRFFPEEVNIDNWVEKKAHKKHKKNKKHKKRKHKSKSKIRD